MAGVEGLEPPNARIKTLCLTNLATPQSGTLTIAWFSQPALFYCIFLFLVSCFLFLVSRCRFVGISAWIAYLPLLFTDSKALQLTVPLTLLPKLLPESIPKILSASAILP